MFFNLTSGFVRDDMIYEPVKILPCFVLFFTDFFKRD